jgi:hypothetical protein
VELMSKQKDAPCSREQRQHKNCFKTPAQRAEVKGDLQRAVAPKDLAQHIGGGLFMRQ